MRNLGLGTIGVVVLFVVFVLLRDGDGGVAAGEGGDTPEVEAPTEPGVLLGGAGREPQGQLLGIGGDRRSPDRQSSDRGASKDPELEADPGAIDPLDPPPANGPDRSSSDESLAGAGPPAPETGELVVGAPPAAYELEREIDVAGELYHLTPPRFHGWMKEADRGLHADRQTLALAFSSAIGGVRQDWGPVRAHLVDSARVDETEVELLDRAIARRPHAAQDLRRRDASALAIAMDLCLRRQTAFHWLDERDYEVAARELSTLLLEEINAPWEADRESLLELTQALCEAQEGHRWNRKGNWPAHELEVQPGDSLIAIRKRFLADPRFEHLSICTGLIDRANGLGGRPIRAGQKLRIPLEPVNVLVDLTSRWVLYRMGDEVVAAWEVGIGAPDSPTRTGAYEVGEKLEEPPWFRPGEAPIPYGDPRNALGSRWLGWDDDLGPTSLGFHGTIEPETVGQEVSEGCVRLRNGEVEELFEILPRGAQVLVQE